MAQFTKEFFDTIGNWEAGFQNESNDITPFILEFLYSGIQ